MENNQVEIKNTATNYGLYYAIFGIIIILILYALDTEKNIALSVINTIGNIVIFVLSILAFKKSNNGSLKLGQALKVGLATAAIGGLLIAIYSFIHYTYIQPEFIEAIRQNALEEMYTKNPDLSADAVEKASGMMNIFTSPGFIATVGLVGSLFIGLVVSLITGLAAKTE